MDKNWFEKQHHWTLIAILMSIAYFLLMFGNNIVSLTHRKYDSE